MIPLFTTCPLSDNKTRFLVHTKRRIADKGVFEVILDLSTKTLWTRSPVGWFETALADYPANRADFHHVLSEMVDEILVEVKLHRV